MSLVLLLAGLAGGEAHVALPPEAIDSAKQSADYRITVQLESIERIESGSGGALDKARAEGRVVAVTRTPAGAGANGLQAGNRVAFRVPAWPRDSDDEEPPGPDRLYWGPGAPLPLLEVWGFVREGEFVASVFERTVAAPGSIAPGSVTEVLDLIDRIAAAVGEQRLDLLPGAIENLTGLRFDASGDEARDRGGFLHLRASGDGWARGAELRDTASGPLFRMTLADFPCVRSTDVTERHGTEARPIPAPPGKALPSTWQLEYQRPWGELTYGFRFARAGGFDDCLVEFIVHRGA